MRALLLPLLATALLPLGCSNAEAGDVPAAHPTAQGAVERIDRLQFLSNASSALLRAEDAWHHGKSPDADLVEAGRLVGLAQRSASAGGEPTEAGWESRANQAVGSLNQSLNGKDAAKADEDLGKAKLYLDQAQQAASIEF
ncbi:MAG: hypothetical protein ACYCWW_11075 [Deltaproteobacteria bacterium]